MATFEPQNRKSTAPPPPPVSQLWQMASSNNNWSFTSSDNDTHEIIEEDEMNKLLDKNGDQRKSSISRQYAHPKPPLHATHAITNQYHNFDDIIKNNPYRHQTKNIYTNHNINGKITTKSRKKRIIRPINAVSVSMDNNNNNKRTHNDSIDAFLRHRTPESELKNRHILMETNTETKQKQKEEIKYKLSRRLSNKFRPQQRELYDRGIFVTDPKNNPQTAAWDHANRRRRNSQILAQKFSKRPHPNDVLNKGIMTKDDYFEMFNILPQTQPPSPITPIIMDMNLPNTQYDFKEKLSFKIKQRPTVNQMKSKGIIYDDPNVPVALQNRKRALHRRRASKILQKFLSNRPKQETLKQRRIMVSPRVNNTNIKKNKVWITCGQLCNSKKRESLKIRDFLLRRPPASKLVSKHILPSEYVQSNHLNGDFKSARQNYIRRRKQSRTDLENHLIKKKKRDFKKKLDKKFQSRPEIDQVPYRYFMPNQDQHSKRIVSKSRASLVLEQFLPVRPEIQQLWDKNILPSLPPSPHKHKLMKAYNNNNNENDNNQTLFAFDTQHVDNNDNGIDKRRNRRQDSMAKLQLRLVERAPRESLFELGILKMSPAPSPPPIEVMKAIQPIDNKSIFDNDEKHNIEIQNTNQLRKKRKFTQKRGSLVLNEFLGENVANKLDQHLYSRPNQSDLIQRGIVPTYSFTKNYSNPLKFATHRRNMTLELQQRLEAKLKARPLLNDLPRKIYAVQENIKQLYNEKKIDSMQQNKIEGLLNEMKASHEKNIEELKQRYWNLLMEEKEKYKHFEMITNRNELTLRQKIESIQNECHSLSTQLIVKNTQMKEEQIEFQQQMIGLKLEYEKQQNSQIHKMNHKQIMNQVANNNISMEMKITAIEKRYQSDLQRERTMHRKFNEQSERVKQTLVDEINKMEIQNQSKLHNLENQISSLKHENIQLLRQKDLEMNDVKTKLCSEIEKERNIATLMVEDLDEEKTRLIQEMNEMKQEYDEKLLTQKKQIEELSQVAQDAVFYGNKAINDNITANDSQHKITDLENKLQEIQNKYNTMKVSKQMLEKQVLQLTQQILDTFSNNLSADVKKKLGLNLL